MPDMLQIKLITHPLTPLMYLFNMKLHIKRADFENILR
ncbi:hypothetical protein J500_2320 [Acinetobacter sp. 479375]|nr:hypothetical protein J500_2320 [Acinetobacter sp. 479375]BBF77677.1 hypothetical protein URS_1687 [Acinetobacter ursingii]